MKRIKINTTWEEDEEERRQFFAGLTYSGRLRYFFKLRNKFNFNNQSNPKERVFKIFHSYEEAALWKDELKRTHRPTNL